MPRDKSLTRSKTIDWTNPSTQFAVKNAFTVDSAYRIDFINNTITVEQAVFADEAAYKNGAQPIANPTNVVSLTPEQFKAVLDENSAFVTESKKLLTSVEKVRTEQEKERVEREKRQRDTEVESVRRAAERLGLVVSEASGTASSPAADSATSDKPNK